MSKWFSEGEAMVVVVYGPLMKLNASQLEVNFKINKVPLQVAVLLEGRGEWCVKVKNRYEKIKTENMIFVKWVCKQMN